MDTLNGLYGHDLIRKRLALGIMENKLFNSYVFCGAKGSGKKTLALQFCAAVMCKNKENNLPCGECDACRKVFSHNHPDVLYVEKEKGKKTIGIDIIRQNVVNNVYIKPLVADKKIIVIKDGEALTEQSQNALLKVLEEPPEYASFIIITESIGMLLKTVLSRSVVFNLMPLENCLIEKILTERADGKYSVGEINFAVKFSQGIPGKGLDILENEEFSRLYKETAKNVLSIFKKKNAITVFEKFLTEEKENIDIIINFILALLRDCILIKLGRTGLAVCEDYVYDLTKSCANLSAKRLNTACDAVLQFRERLSRNAGFLSACLDMLLKLSEQLTV